MDVMMPRTISQEYKGRVLHWSAAGKINCALGQARGGDGKGGIGCDPDPGEFQGMDHTSS